MKKPKRKSITLKQFAELPLKTTLSHLDQVNHPSHYGGADDPFETIKVAEAKLTVDELVGAYKFQIQAYLDRHRQKGGFEDLKKAQFYLNRLVSFLAQRGLEESVGPQH